MPFSQERFNAWRMADAALEVRPFANADASRGTVVIGVARLFDAPVEWSRQHQNPGLVH